MGLQQAKQSYREPFYRLDVQSLGNTGKKSFENKTEEAGIVKATLAGNIIKLTAKKSESGTVDSVTLPDGPFTYHTHPRQCPDLKNCSLLPPSADDMRIFAQRKNTQAVMSRDFTYLLRLRPECVNFEKSQIDALYQFFKVFEDHFDHLKKGSHDNFDYLWNNAVVWSNWFDIIRFDNNECLHSFRSNQIYTVIPDNLISLASPI